MIIEVGLLLVMTLTLFCDRSLDTSWFDVNVRCYFTIVSASALDCYRCTSSQPGCGKELNIRIQRWHTCPGTGIYGGENFCVKVVEKINGTLSTTEKKKTFFLFHPLHMFTDDVHALPITKFSVVCSW